jgi:hypothetical protein
MRGAGGGGTVVQLSCLLLSLAGSIPVFCTNVKNIMQANIHWMFKIACKLRIKSPVISMRKLWLVGSGSGRCDGICGGRRDIGWWHEL